MDGWWWCGLQTGGLHNSPARSPLSSASCGALSCKPCSEFIRMSSTAQAVSESFPFPKRWPTCRARRTLTREPKRQWHFLHQYITAVVVLLCSGGPGPKKVCARPGKTPRGERSSDHAGLAPAGPHCVVTRNRCSSSSSD